MQEPLHFEASLGAVICHRCESGVVVNSVNSINNHFRGKAHRLKGAALQAIHAQFQQWPARLTSEVRYPPVEEQPVRAIPHLKCHRGWQCRHCDWWLSADLVNSKTHLRHVHGISRGREGRDLGRCRLQTVFREKQHIRYFRVADDAAVEVEGGPEAAGHPPAEEDIHLFLSSQASVVSQIEAEEQAQAAKVRALDDHQFSVIPWVRSCGFDRHLQGFDQREIRRSSRRPDADEIEGEQVQRIADTAVQLLEETWTWCVDGPACRLTRPMAVMLSQFWTEATIHSRGFRVGVGPDTKSRYFGLWAQAIFCFWRVSNGHALVRAKQVLPAGSGSDGDEAGSAGAAHTEKLLFTGTPEQQSLFDQCLQAAAHGDDELLRQHVVGLSMSLIRQNLPRNRYDSPLLSYCATLAVNHSSQGWKLPGNFNSSLSGLIYCAQLWIFREACRLEDQGPRSSLDETLADLCRQWMRQERSTTYGTILNWRLMLFNVARQHVSSKKATWSLDGSEVSYQGTAIRMEHVTQLYQRTLARARMILDRDLLLGADHLPRMSASALREGEHRQEVGWWFGLDDRNARLLQGRETRLLEHIKATPAYRQMFLLDGDEWRPSAMRLYEHHIQQFLECFFVLFQMLPPLRGPESMSVTWRNTEKVRSIFLKHQRVMVYTTYHKGQAQWGSYKDNVRFLPTELGDMLLDFIAYVPPLWKIFLWKRCQRLLPPHLWTKDGQIWDEKTLTRVMRKACAAAEVPLLSESHWRQLCATVIKMKFSGEQGCFEAISDVKDREGIEDIEEEDGDGEGEDVAMLARLSNHTVRTHNRAYANETSLIAANVWDGLIKRSYRACMLWAHFFRFEEPTTAESLGSKRVRGRESDDRGILKKIALSVPEVRRHWTGRALLQEARKMYQNPQLQWRCVEQERAVCAVMSGVMEVVIVLATGMGKTLLFQLPCVLPHAGTTVAIVPLVALRLDLIRRCRALGIDCQEWAADHQTHAALVFLSVEAAASEEGRQYLFELHHARQLRRIVIEEFHLIITASHYRRAMGQLALLRSIPVQFVYLTATLPPSMEDELFKRHYLTQVHTIRASTRRGNLKYGVRRLMPRQQDIFKESASILQQLWQEQFGSTSGPHRAIIFTRTRTGADDLAALLGCRSYHADVGNVPEKAQIISSWASGEGSPFLVGTSGLGAGLDYPSVRVVMHVDEPYGLMEFVQESGRGGRDGAPAESIVVLRHAWKPRSPFDIDMNEAWLHRYLTSEGCRRGSIEKFMDHVDGASCCPPQTVACDHCSQGHSPPTPTELIPPHAPSQTQEARGPHALLRQARDDQNEISIYQDHLEAVKGQCMICRIHGRDDWQHSFSQCRQVAKWEFIHTKREVLRQTQQKWVRRYDACFHCYQPQALCARQEGGGRCQYGDLVMQTVFALYQEEKVQQWLLREFQVQFAEVDEYLIWAGKTNELGGVVCVNGVVVLHRVLLGYSP